MIISAEKLSEYINGTVGTHVSDGFLVCERFTEEQKEFYDRTTPEFHKKLYATSSIRADFITDASKIEFDALCTIGSSRNFCYADITCDGEIIYHGGTLLDTGVINKIHVSADIPEGTHLVSVHLPGLASMQLGNIELADASVLEKRVPKMRFLCLGDSITQGYDAKYPSNAYASGIGSYFDAEIINQAIGGDVFREGIPAKLEGKFNLITVAYGTNDWTHARSHDEFEGALNRFFKRLTSLYPDNKVVYISPIWRYIRECDNAEDKVFPDFDEATLALEKEASKFKNVTVIHGPDVSAHSTEYFSDGCLHPNDEGYKIYTEKLIEKLKGVL